ncbi:lipid-A-disaccharide synthase N-terminal domain-containing protein [Azospirillum sp.]|uniref:lipid-A-disaccharide synthase N-terminal domain-containing protein n=1 Tax=Azospirillum sp. TaxID=34012 RepID=UPI002D4362DD|nr:lipid-A-disaccharide synthase N-terminal domain-containing protein [Azospirillum sp.]HYD65880.1 lipid-A-disaccharide synthase N-terminal domain-containing protein [Azospirillum sp.]
MIDALVAWFNDRSTTEIVWIGIGFFAQALFMMRFVVQWIASERVRRSIVPETFWYFSIGGGILLLAYSIYRMDPVYMFGQGLGLLIYFRNLYFVWTHKREGAAP